MADGDQDVLDVLAATAADAMDQGDDALVNDVNTIIASYVATDPE